MYAACWSDYVWQIISLKSDLIVVIQYYLGKGFLIKWFGGWVESGGSDGRMLNKIFKLNVKFKRDNEIGKQGQEKPNEILRKWLFFLGESVTAVPASQEKGVTTLNQGR